MKKNEIKYLTIHSILKNQILKNEYPIGTLFPTEKKLQTIFNASRITIRHAVQLLVDEGFLDRIHGVGTIVISIKESLQLQTLLSFSEENYDESVNSELIHFNESVRANSFVCANLDIPTGSRVILHERLRSFDHLPIGFQRVYHPSYISITEQELTQSNVSLYQLLRKKGVVVSTAHETIESIVGNESVRQILNINDEIPLLFVQRITKDQKNRIVEFAEIFYRGDRYRYNVHLQAPR